MAKKNPEGSPRERLLAAADELFYREGIHAVGIDRVLERAGVAKASLYSSFGSKEELVRAYLQQRADARQRRILDRVAQHQSPRDRILSIFDLQAENTLNPNWRGCAFINAAAEGAPEESKTRGVCRDSRGWLRELLTSLAEELGAQAPERLGRQLALIYDGVAAGMGLDPHPETLADARAMVVQLLDDATGLANGD